MNITELDINGYVYPDVGVTLSGRFDLNKLGELIIIYGPLTNNKGEMNLDL